MSKFTVALLDAIAAVAKEHLGPNHDCVRAITEAMKSHEGEPGERILAAVNELPTAHRDNVLLQAKKRMNEEADVLNLLGRCAGLPGKIPPDVTQH